jgi:hypothetical protein
MKAGRRAPLRKRQRPWFTHRIALGAVLLVFLGALLTIGPALWSTVKRQLPNSPTYGDILVDTPEVYTRERLVNDRLTQEAWLRAQLDRTTELLKSDRFAGVEGRLARSERNAATLAGLMGGEGALDDVKEPEGTTAATGSAATDFEPNPVDVFRDAQTYRDMIRAELMRTQLDDRHDIEGNTLYRLDFDTAVSPGANTTSLAVVTVAIQDDGDDGIYQAVYDDFYKELQMEIDGAIKNMASALMTSAEGLPGADRLAFDEFLHRLACDELKDMARLIDEKVNMAETNSSFGYCFNLVNNIIRQYARDHEELRRRYYNLLYADGLRNYLIKDHVNREDRDGKLPDPLRRLKQLAPEALRIDRLSTGEVERLRRALDDAARYATERCVGVKETSSGKRFALIADNVVEDAENQDRSRVADEYPCPPDLGEGNPTMAAMVMLWRLQAIIDDLNSVEGSGSDRPQGVVRGGELKDELLKSTEEPRRMLMAAANAQEADALLKALAHVLPQLIVPYGSPLLDIVCSQEDSQDSPNCLPAVKNPNPAHPTLCDADRLKDSEICDSVAAARILGRFGPGSRQLERIDVEKFVAHFFLRKLNSHMKIYQYPLDIKWLFPGSGVQCSTRRCTVVLVPLRCVDVNDKDCAETEGDKLGCADVNDEDCAEAERDNLPVHRLRDILKTGARAFSYAVMPTEWSQAMATEDLTHTSLLAALRAAAVRGDGNFKTVLEGLNQFEERVETRHRNAIVVGFGIGPVEDRAATSEPIRFRRPGVKQKAEDHGSRARTKFGWIIRPRLAPAVDGGGRNFRQVPGAYPLSAIISVPSWWRLLKLEVRTQWLEPHEWWFESERPAADLLASGNMDCDPPACQFQYVRLPGSVKEIKEKLRYEVRKEPYIDFETTPKNQLLEIGRAGQIALQGARLWRSPIVRMGHQQADRIFVLPDMRGIIAEFSCVQPPPGELGQAGDPRGAQGEPGPTPVHVWTSEGRTADPFMGVWLRPFVTRKIGLGANAEYLKPCYLDGDNQAANDGDGPPTIHGPSKG